MSSKTAIGHIVERTDRLLQRHPRGLTVLVVSLLLGSAVTAFGVAPLAPDASALPRRILTESVTQTTLDAQLQALETHALELYRSDLTRSGDTADTLLLRLGVDDPDVAAFLRTDPQARRLLEGRPGKMVQVQTAGWAAQFAGGSVSSDVFRSALDSLHAADHRSQRDRLAVAHRTGQLATESRLGSGTIVTSLFAAADESRLPDAVTVQLAEIFGTDIDFRRDLKRGDTFTVLYESLTADGEPLLWNQASGRVLAAQFVNGGKTYDAIWFEGTGAGGRAKGAYFSLDGRSKNRMFLASPVAFSRVTSGFAMRMHPILQTWRAHLGVDYAAPTGTPVRAVGDGAVEFAGWQNGYGNVVILRHAGDRETRYAHLSRLNVRQGQRVEQGQQVGDVGATGWATGPHLHFEFRMRGAVVDPMKIARESEPIEISAAARSRFAEQASAARSQLAVASAMGTAAVE